MNTSHWPTTLAAFCEEVSGSNPAPAAVAVAAVTASFGLSLLIKVLEITGKRKSFTGDSQRLRTLIQAARLQSEQLKIAADDDIAAVHEYLRSRSPEAVRAAIEVPMRAARAAVAGINLCGDAVDLIHGLPAADLGAAVLIVSGSVRAILLSVDFNLRQLHPEEPFRHEILVERGVLEEQTARLSAAVLLQISGDA